MNGNGQMSMIEKVFGLNWQPRLGATLAAAGGVLVDQTPTGTWHTIGKIMFAVGVLWVGGSTRAVNVTSDQMQAVKDSKEAALETPGK